MKKDTRKLRIEVLSCEGEQVTRRQVLKAGAAVAVFSSVPSLLSACTEESQNAAPGPNATSSVAPSRGGTLRVGVAGGGSKGSIDPANAIVTADNPRLMNLYDQLGDRGPNYELTLQLAEEITPNATGDEWTVRVKDGIEFHNGKTLRAEDIIFTFNRALDPDFTNTMGPIIGPAGIKNIRKLDDRTVRFSLAGPFAVFREFVSVPLYEGIVPVGFDVKNPVGTGPFKLESYSPGRETVLVRNDNYWGQVPYLDRVVLTEIADDAARVNALLGGDVDAINVVPGSQIRVFEQTSGFLLLRGEGGAQRLFTMLHSQAPFNDVRVRQALRLIADREAMVAQALSGEGKVANDLSSPLDSCYASEIPQREQDIEQAKALLREAGVEDLSITLDASNLTPGLSESAAVYAEQAKAAGVSIDIRKIPPGEFFLPPGYPHPFGVSFWQTTNFSERVGLSLLPGAYFNDSGYDDPDFTDLATAALKEMNDDERCQLFKDAQQVFWEQGSELIWAFANTVDAHTDKVAGFPADKTGRDLSGWRLEQVWMRS